jgi:hypothetical protein
MQVHIQHKYWGLFKSCRDCREDVYRPGHSGLHHLLERMQLQLSLCEGGFGLNATAVASDSNAVEYQPSLSLHTGSSLAAAGHCHDPHPKAHSSPRPSSQLHSVHPPLAIQRPVPPSVRICGAPSPIATLPCALLGTLLGFLTPCSSRCQQTLPPGRSRSRPNLSHALNRRSAA